MTDPIVTPEQKIEYAKIIGELDPFAARVENLSFRIPIYFFDKEEAGLNLLSEEEFQPIKESFPDIEITDDYHDVYLACSVMKTYFSMSFQSGTYCFFVNLPFVGYISEPFYEEYLGDTSQGRHLLKEGISENVFNKILSIKEVLEKKFDQRLAAD